jgi:hypothetical protein
LAKTSLVTPDGDIDFDVYAGVVQLRTIALGHRVELTG